MLTTELIGSAALADHGMVIEIRIVRRDEDGRRFRVLGASLSTTSHRSVRAAREAAEIEWRSRGATVTWRDSCGPRGDERSCYCCGVFLSDGAEARARYPDELCPACILEAVDEIGLPLRFGNTAMGGGFAATYVADGRPRDSHICYVRARKYWADEAHLGGIVVIPFERHLARTH